MTIGVEITPIRLLVSLVSLKQQALFLHPVEWQTRYRLTMFLFEGSAKRVPGSLVHIRCMYEGANTILPRN